MHSINHKKAIKNFILYNLTNKYITVLEQLIYAVTIDFVSLIMINGPIIMEIFVHLIKVFFKIDSIIFVFL